MKKILIYGAGTNCEAVFENVLPTDIKIVGVVDKNKQGTTIGGFVIRNIEDISSIEYDEIWVTPKKNEGIVNYLTKQVGITREKISLPADINCNYILKRISGATNVFLSRTGYQSCFSFVFRKMEEKKSLLILRVLDCEEEIQWDNSVDSSKIFFVLLSDDVLEMKKNGMLQYLRSAYPNHTKMLWFCNPCKNIALGIPRIVEEYGSFDALKKEFDYCYTYHLHDAIANELCYYSQFYPDVAKEYEVEQKNMYDVFFIGGAKKRLNTIHDTFRMLVNAQVKCHFFVAGVSEDKRIKAEGLNYIDKYMSYEQSLIEMNKCRCVLEICDEGDETSYRYAEAVIFGKKLLVNDEGVKHRKYYYPQNIQFFDDIMLIDTDWIKKPSIDYGYAGEYEPEFFFHNLLSGVNYNTIQNFEISL